MSEPEEIQQGNSSIVKIYRDLGYVVKTPNEGVDPTEFIKKQKHASDIMTKVAIKLHDAGVDIDIPSTLNIDTDNAEIRESYIPGDKFNISTYKNLDDKTRDKLAKDLASFMIAMHQMSEPEIMQGVDGNKLLDKDIGRLLKKDDELQKAGTDEKINYVLNRLHNEDIKKLVQNAVEYIKQHDDVANKINVTRHHDLRDGNIFYEKSKNRLGIIDFEGAGVGHIYEDFVGSPPSLHWNFITKVIEYYNKLSQQADLNITINPEIIKHWLIFRTVWVNIKRNLPEEEIMKQFKQLGLVRTADANSCKKGILKVIEKAENLFQRDDRDF